MIEVIEKNWLGRITKYDANELNLQTPEIFYISTRSIKAPSYARATIVDSDNDSVPENSLRMLRSRFFSGEEMSGISGIDPLFRGGGELLEESAIPVSTCYSDGDFSKCDGDIVVVGDAARLSRKPREFAKTFSGLRRKVSPKRLIYAPGIADPFNLSLLCYFGVDLVDSLGTIARSSLGQVIVHGRAISSASEDLDRISGLEPNPSFEDILEHNYRQLESELVVVRDAIRTGTLRQLVELRARHAPWMIEALRFADLEEFSNFEEWTPVYGNEFVASAKESLWRPDIRRYRERLLERYEIPKSPRILVLLPCSAKKPYSTSKSHRAFRGAIKDSGIASAVHEVIVTSPLGIVPRELETVYPAQQYDIPVTGHWDEDEKKIARELLINLLSRKRYDVIIAHLDIEFEFISDVLQECELRHTGGENVNSRESIASLRDCLSGLKDSVEKTPWTMRTYEDIKALCSYQFGDAWPHLMEDSVTKGAYPNIRVMRGNSQLCSFVPSKGGLSLTIEGGKALARSGKYGVEIEDFVPKTNIFAVGVKRASPEIRAGDEVYVYHADEVRAVGTARMNSLEMTSLDRGEAVHIRHHI
ncbi:MAG: archaeosine synthase subunit alpha [Thermoplasmata archaeon]